MKGKQKKTTKKKQQHHHSQSHQPDGGFSETGNMMNTAMQGMIGISMIGAMGAAIQGVNKQP